MAIERSFAILKPDTVKDGHMREIITAIEQGGLKINAMKLTRLTPALCKGFYHEHVTKGFYQELEDFMTEGPLVIMTLEGENAIVKWRDLMGATNPANAAEGTLRKRFGANIGRNATHGSDAPASAAFEVGYFFNAFEQM